ncbi:Arc family DNA-binding protein [Mesorhizobium sp. SB112]|uniref:Arc family DNA-binding protein n=1 Tax=Mesorhizobium sp. SB112 TaxID=3151853 RepID=UPI0032664F99
MAREDLHFRLRIPEDLKKRIEAIADFNGRSMTAEIVARLETSLNEERRDRVDAAMREQLSLDLAYERGRSASLENSLNIFMRRLVGSEADTSGLLEKILEDIRKASPPRGEG